MQNTLPAQDNRCTSSPREVWERMTFFNRVVRWKPHPLIGVSGMPSDVAEFVALLNDAHAMIARFLWVYRKVQTITKTISYASSSTSASHSWRERRMTANSIIKLIISKKNGLGFTPTLKNSALGTLMLYHLLKLAGICAEPVALVEHAPRYCVRAALDPLRPAKRVAIDLTLLLHRTITADSVIDFYDGDIVTLKTRPVSIDALTRAYGREQAIDLPASQR